MPVYTSSIEVTADYPTIKPSLNFDFAKTRSLSSSIVHLLPLNDSSFGVEGLRTSYIGKDGLVKFAAANEPRFDHDPDTLESLGLLLEDDATNLVTYSQDFTQSVWQTANNRATCDNTTGIDDPSGGTTASRWSSGTSNGQELIYRQTGTSAGTLTGQTCTKSTWIRRVSNDGNVAFFIGDNVSNSVTSQLDSVPVGTWVRCSITYTVVGNNGDTRNYIAVYPGTDGQPTTIDIWGDQFETGAFPTSYIPTKDLAVTRGNHVTLCRNDNVLLSGDITIVAEYQMRLDTQWNRLFGLGENASDIRPLVNSSGQINFFNYSTEFTVPWPVSQPDTSTSFKFAMAVRRNVANSVVINGGSVNTQTNTNPGALVNWNQLYFGWASTGNNPRYMNGHIKSFRIYNEALTDAQLQLLTA